MLWCGVLRAVDNAQVLSPPAFHRWLHQTALVFRESPEEIALRIMVEIVGIKATGSERLAAKLSVRKWAKPRPSNAVQFSSSNDFAQEVTALS